MAVAAVVTVACQNPDSATIQVQGVWSNVIFSKDSVAEGSAKTYPLGVTPTLDARYIRLTTKEQPRPVLEVVVGAHEDHFDRLRAEGMTLISASPDSSVADSDYALYQYYQTWPIVGAQAAYPFDGEVLDRQNALDQSFYWPVAYGDGMSIRLYSHGTCSTTISWNTFFQEVLQGITDSVDESVQAKGLWAHWGGMWGWPYLGLDRANGVRPDGSSDGFALVGQFSVQHYLAGRLWVAWTHGYRLHADPGGRGVPSAVTVSHEPWGDTVGNSFCLGTAGCHSVWPDVADAMTEQVPAEIGTKINSKLALDAFSLSFDLEECGGKVPCKGAPLACTPGEGAASYCHDEWTSQVVVPALNLGLGWSEDEAEKGTFDMRPDDFECAPVAATGGTAAGKCVFHVPVAQVNVYADEFELVFREPRERALDENAKWFTPKSAVAVLSALAAKYSPDDPMAHVCDRARIGKKPHYRDHGMTAMSPGGAP
ncbi:MAG: hypothetical protein IT374_26025 [Polyangiaceae bacterium]|nr:hypothetical protein [Polyangiaceae bacterium]